MRNMVAKMGEDCGVFVREHIARLMWPFTMIILVRA